MLAGCCLWYSLLNCFGTKANYVPWANYSLNQQQFSEQGVFGCSAVPYVRHSGGSRVLDVMYAQCMLPPVFKYFHRLLPHASGKDNFEIPRSL
eukprot:1634018-Amphidinium_carterae.1